MNCRAVGSRYERKAAEYLESRGYEILEKNFRCPQGEIDLIARHKGILVFIEIKYRRGKNYGYPEEAVDHKKQRTIGRAARIYLHRKKLSDIPCRFDVVAADDREIRIIEDAFWIQGG